MNELNDSNVEPSLSVGYVAATLSEYRRALTLLWLALALVAMILALAFALLMPGERITTVPFRLQFTGADIGQYPNGTRFNSTEIVATPLLLHVFNTNNLGRYTTYEKFRSSIFVSEQNPALDRLAATYEPRFADPRLGPLDRQRLEEDYQLKRASIGRSEFALNLVRSDTLKLIPEDIARKTVADVLALWAEQAVASKGVISLRVPLVDAAQFSDDSAGRNYLMAADILRRRALRLDGDIETLIAQGGGELRPNSQSIVGQLRVELDELRRFRIDPLVTTLAGAPESRNAQTQQFLEAAATDARRDRDQATSRMETLRQSMAMYEDEQRQQLASTAQRAANANGSEGRTVTPQVSDAFLNQLVDLVANSKDQAFRQQLTVSFARESNERLIPSQQQVAYYETLLAALHGGTTSVAPADAAARYADALNRARAIASRLHGVYVAAAEDLNPGRSIYTVTGTPVTRRARATNLPRIATYWLLFVLFAIPLLVAGSLLHKRARRDLLASSTPVHV